MSAEIESSIASHAVFKNADTGEWYEVIIALPDREPVRADSRVFRFASVRELAGEYVNVLVGLEGVQNAMNGG